MVHDELAKMPLLLLNLAIFFRPACKLYLDHYPYGLVAKPGALRSTKFKYLANHLQEQISMV